MVSASACAMRSKLLPHDTTRSRSWVMAVGYRARLAITRHATLCGRTSVVRPLRRRLRLVQPAKARAHDAVVRCYEKRGFGRVLSHTPPYGWSTSARLSVPVLCRSRADHPCAGAGAQIKQLHCVGPAVEHETRCPSREHTSDQMDSNQ